MSTGPPSHACRGPLSRNRRHRRAPHRHPPRRQQQNAFEEHPEVHVKHPPGEERLQQADPALRIRRPEHAAIQLQRDHGEAEDDGLAEAIFVFAEALVGRTSEEIVPLCGLDRGDLRFAICD